jgi:hypothetical protein
MARPSECTEQYAQKCLTAPALSEMRCYANWLPPLFFNHYPNWTYLTANDISLVFPLTKSGQCVTLPSGSPS